MQVNLELMPPDTEERHAQACHHGKKHYRDPGTGRRVQTATFLQSRGFCCNLECRHCPFPASVEAAGVR